MTSIDSKNNKETEVYYGIEYRLGHAWQPISSYTKYKALKTFEIACQELDRIADLETNHAESRSTNEFRLIRYESQIYSEVVKTIQINS